jgi:DNA-binding response OmpR family regulator
MKVLIVEDDQNIASFLKAHLPCEGFVVDVASTGAQGTNLVQLNEYDLCIVDMNLPDCTGADVIQSIREERPHVPVLVLTVMKGTEMKVRMLNDGADDYLVKPFEYTELLARMRALLRRPRMVIPERIVIGTVTLDSAAQLVRRKERDIELTQKEFLLLEYLMRNRGRIISKCALIERAWDSAADQFSDAIDTHLSNLRKKLGKPTFIHTAHGRGYRVG